ncbi:MAG: CHASE domain-containing protein [Verrucomicrobia bacterium]|nr:CHASE domain-containing protein [Verrucomicrobiota bacterium]
MTARLRFRWPIGAWLSMVGGIVITGLVATRLYWDDEARVRREFVHEVNAYAHAINGQVGKNVAILRSLKAFFDSSDPVTRTEFHTFGSFLLAHYPSMIAVEWIPRIEAGRRIAFEAAHASRGTGPDQIMEKDTKGRLIPAGPRAAYYPICYIEPLAGNEAAMAFDIGSHPTRRKAIEAARDTGEARATERIRLVQETANHWGVVFLQPVYDGAPTTMAARQQALKGFVAGVIRVRDILEAATEATMLCHGMIHMALHDDVPGDTVVLAENDVGTARLVQPFRYEKRLNPAGGRQWVLQAPPTAAYFSEGRSYLPVASVAIGLLITGWVVFNIVRFARENRRIERQVDARTNDVNQQAIALATSNDKLTREVLRRRELQERFADVTDHEQRRLGQELHDSLGQQMAATAMLSESLHRRMAAAGAPDAEPLWRLTEIIRTAQAQVRALSKALLPVEVDSRGLKAALDELICGARMLGKVAVTFHYDHRVVLDDNVVATHLYRVAQEGLRHAMERSDVSAIAISVEHDNGGLMLNIRDDSVDPGTETLANLKAGLSTMMHRINLINGRLNITSVPGKGTRVTCFVPG